MKCLTIYIARNIMVSNINGVKEYGREIIAAWKFGKNNGGIH